MARGDDDTGSLDMLLDTLCNTFGGIILIALLLALSVNDKSKELYDKIPYRKRDDEAEMQKHVDPNWKRIFPRW